MIDDRIITDFAEHLVPEAFARPHTADRVEVVDVSDRGQEGFERWLVERVVAVPRERYAWGGRPVLYAIVESADGTRWRWDDSGCCEPAWLARRVRDECAELPEPWVFAVRLDWPDEIWEVEDPETCDYIRLPEPIVPPGDWPATWYAEARGRGLATVAAGRLWIGPSDGITTNEPLPPRQGVPGAFHGILRGHPDRKRHPLRRRHG